MSMMCEITTMKQSQTIRNLIEPWIIGFTDIDMFTYSKVNVKVFINGDWIDLQKIRMSLWRNSVKQGNQV